jgi:apolipoprotein N-acyltransferase
MNNVELEIIYKIREIEEETRRAEAKLIGIALIVALVVLISTPAFTLMLGEENTWLLLAFIFLADIMWFGASLLRLWEIKEERIDEVKRSAGAKA